MNIKEKWFWGLLDSLGYWLLNLVIEKLWEYWEHLGDVNLFFQLSILKYRSSISDGNLVSKLRCVVNMLDIKF